MQDRDKNVFCTAWKVSELWTGTQTEAVPCYYLPLLPKQAARQAEDRDLYIACKLCKKERQVTAEQNWVRWISTLKQDQPDNHGIGEWSLRHYYMLWNYYVSLALEYFHNPSQ